MQSKDYWTLRALQRETEAYKSTADVNRRLRAIYEMSAARLDRIINAILASYMRASGIEDKEKALRLLSIQETAEMLALLREEYEKTGSAEALARLNAPAYAYRISRVRAIKKAIDAECEVLREREQQIGAQQLAKIYYDTYYKTMYDTAKGLGQDITFMPLSQRVITQAVENRWKGENYSERVWKNTQLVAQEGGKIIDTGIASGASVAQMAKEIKDLFDVAAYAAERLVRTEINRMHNDAAIRSYKDMGIEEYIFLATLDARTCEKCGALDLKRFKVSEAQTGVNLPPIHPNDRCTIMAYFPHKNYSKGTRMARNIKTGKNYKVPRDMSYEEWRKEVGTDELDKAQKMIRNRSTDIEQQKAMRNVLGKEVPANIADFQDLKYNNPEEFARLKRAVADRMIKNRLVSDAQPPSAV